nr:hypothetical protein [uncultured Pseudomonas sp.]
MTVRLALYKAPGDLVDRAVRFWTRSIYSHCELVLADGRFVSSSPRDGGVRAKCIEPAQIAWDFVALPWVKQEDVEAALKREGGAGYDWVGIIGSQLLPVGIHSRRRWFCSEFCGAVMGLEKPERYSPGELAELVAWMGRVSVPSSAL